MIHVIPHHIGKGSYAAWYDCIDWSLCKDLTIHKFDTKYKIENKSIVEDMPPNDDYFNILENHIQEINPNMNDWIICDFQYVNYSEPGFEKDIVKLSKKYKVKLVFIDDDNYQPYTDTEHYTFHSNKFNYEDTTEVFNYYRYRIAKTNWYDNLYKTIYPFVKQRRPKKINFFVGVDKLERLEIYKYIHNIGLDKESHLAYSGFSKDYSDDKLSDSLLEWRNKNVPKVLDTTFEESQIGQVNPDLPPLAYCLTSYVSCIMETKIIVDTNELEVHLSEKSWNPFCSFNIPLILGSYGIKKYLKRCGYWLADDLFDTSEKESFREILDQYKSNLDIINNMSNQDLRDYYIGNWSRLEHNFFKMQQQQFTFNQEKYKQPNFNKELL